jgi:hypothetical protein
VISHSATVRANWSAIMPTVGGHKQFAKGLRLSFGVFTELVRGGFQRRRFAQWTGLCASKSGV